MRNASAVSRPAVNSRMFHVSSWRSAASVLLIVSLVVSLFFVAYKPVTPAKAVQVPLSIGLSAQQEGSLFHVIGQLQAGPQFDSARSLVIGQPHFVWFGLNKLDFSLNSELAVQARQIAHSQCWQASSARLLVETPVNILNGRLLSIDLRGQSSSLGVLCEMVFSGPSHIESMLMVPGYLDSSALAFEKRRGFLEGFAYLMIGMVAVAALVSRRSIFICYGVWLFASLRFVALQEGWDHDFFGWQLSGEGLLLSKNLTLAFYYVATVFIVVRLFDNLRRSTWRPVLRLLQASCLLLPVLALQLPQGQFSAVFWSLGLCALLAGAVVMLQYASERRNLLAVYYLATMGASFSGLAGEGLASWFGYMALAQVLNSGTALLCTSIMSAVALAEFLRVAYAQKRLALNQIRLSHERLKNMFNIAPSAMFTACGSGLLVQHNQRFADEYLDSHGGPLFAFLQPSALQAAFNSLSPMGKPKRYEIKLARGAQRDRWFELVISRNAQELIGMVSDFSSRKDREMALQYQATHDELTTALNRRGLMQSIQHALEKDQGPLTFVCLDVKRFGKVAAACGQPVSDLLLCSLATELQKQLGELAELARFHVDQFVCFAPAAQATRLEGVFEQFAKRLHSSPLRLSDGRSLSVEVLITKVRHLCANDVVDVLDALESALQMGKTRYRARPALAQVVFEHDEVRQLLAQARTLQQLSLRQLPAGLSLAWQPILSMQAGAQGLYAEALLRIRDQHGRFAPAKFLVDACVYGGHTAFLDNWVLSQSLDFMSNHLEQLDELQCLSINVTPGSLNDEAFLQDAWALLNLYKHCAHKICLEITEVGSVINLGAVQAFLSQVRGIGVKVALDDFGAGYSNFRYAIDLQADVIKIDGSIVQRIVQNPESRAVTAGIVRLAHDLGCTCVAEWVEDAQTLAVLRGMGVDFVQGFFVSPAMEPSAFFRCNSTLALLSDPRRVVLIRDALA